MPSSDKKVLAISVSDRDAFYGVFDGDFQLQNSDRISFDDCVSKVEYIDILKKHETLSDSFDQISIICKSAGAVAVPHNFHEHHPIERDCKIYYRSHPAGQSIDIVWSIDRQLDLALTTMFPQARRLPMTAAMADKVYPTTRQVALIHFDNTKLYVVAFDRTHFKLSKSFEVASKEDYLYAIMYSLQLAQLDPRKLTLRISGDLYLDSAIYKILRRYVKELRFAAPAQLQLKTRLPENVKHRYFELYAAATCA